MSVEVRERDELSECEPLLKIGAVAKMADVSVHRLRMWERRHSAVAPRRSIAGARRYSLADVERVRQLLALTCRGHAIAQLADLKDEQLTRLLRRTPPFKPDGSGPPTTRAQAKEESVAQTRQLGALVGSIGQSHADIEPDFSTDVSTIGVDERPVGLESAELAFCEAVESMQLTAASAVLSDAMLRLAPIDALLELLVPLMAGVGRRCDEGQWSVVHERAASGAFSVALSGLRCDGLAMASRSPRLPVVVATAQGEQHELAALALSALSALCGYRPIHLGTGVPMAEIAKAVELSQSSLVLLSCVATTPPESALLLLREVLPPEVSVVTGGRALQCRNAYYRFHHVVSLAALRQWLGEFASTAQV